MTQRPLINGSMVALLAVLGVIFALTVGDYGISWDETFRWGGGDAKLKYYEALATGNTQQAATLRASGDHYPGLFDLPLALARSYYGGDDYMLGHAWCAFFGLLGIAGAMALAYALGGAPSALLAGVLLALFPRYWGHSFINPKDIPFAATYVWGLWALARVLRDDRRDWRSGLLFGALAGACMAVRVGGLLLLCYAVLFLGIQLIINRVRFGPLTLRRELKQLLCWLPIVAVVAFSILFIFWPAAHKNPFATAAGTISEVSQFGWQGEVLFAGRAYAAGDLPRRYLPEMLARITPDWWWWLVISGVIYLLAQAMNRTVWRSLWAEHRGKLLVAFAVIFPPAYIMVRGSIVYDGARHLLFIIPAAAALLSVVSCAVFRYLRQRMGRSAALIWVAPAFLLAAMALVDMVRLHPYEYVYYNRLSGGLAGVSGRFETDYWGTAFREATEILAAELPARQRPWRITMEPPREQLIARYGKVVIPPPALVEPFLGDHMVLVASNGKETPDFYIASTRNDYDKMRDGELLLTVQRDGVTLVVVKEFQGN